MKVLFLSDSNGYEKENPIGGIVDVYNTEIRIMKALESSQIGLRCGGNWQGIVKDGNIKHELIKSGRLSELKDEPYDIQYKLISGNY